jgi:hypothetical protein
MDPLQYAVYKGTGGKFGAIQFNLQNPHFYCGKQKDFSGSEAWEFVDGRRKLKEGWKLREGCVFLEITSTKPGQKNVYDWDNKVIMALSIGDMGKLLLGLKVPGKTEIMHDPNAKTEKANTVKKFLNCTLSEKGALFSVTKVAGGEKVSHSVPMSPDEVIVLRRLLEKGITTALGW